MVRSPNTGDIHSIGKNPLERFNEIKDFWVPQDGKWEATWSGIAKDPYEGRQS